MSSALEKEEKQYTYADFLEWDEDFRAEIINGVVYEMATPLTLHQRIAARLHIKLANFLAGKTCEAFIAPFGVRLDPKDDKSDDTVVEPDLVVVCDPSKIDERGCNGAPDLVIEILSPSTSHKDRVTKFNAYLQARVREFWIVYPEDQGIAAHIFDDGKYYTRAYGVNRPSDKEDMRVPEVIPVSVLPGLEIDLKEIFPSG
jgi:Uma2 family endonuclease